MSARSGGSSPHCRRTCIAYGISSTACCCILSMLVWQDMHGTIRPGPSGTCRMDAVTTNPAMHGCSKIGHRRNAVCCWHMHSHLCSTWARRVCLHEDAGCVEGGGRVLVSLAGAVCPVRPGEHADRKVLAVLLVAWARVDARLVLLQLGQQCPQHAVNLGAALLKGQALCGKIFLGGSI